MFTLELAKKETFMSRSVFCTATVSQTETIMRNLKNSGFSGSDISVLMADKDGTRDFAHEHNSKAPEGTATGAGTGAVIGGALGWLAGIGALAIPGLGPFIAAGPILAALSGAAVVGTLGGITGALIGMGIPEFEAKRFEGKVKAGSSLISIHCDDSDESDRATAICEAAGADDITIGGEVAVHDKEQSRMKDTVIYDNDRIIADAPPRM
jgi:hypothetical protein